MIVFFFSNKQCSEKVSVVKDRHISLDVPFCEKSVCNDCILFQ